MSVLIWIQTIYILIVFLKEFFEKVNFEKIQQMTKNMKNYPEYKELMTYLLILIFLLEFFVTHLFISAVWLHILADHLYRQYPLC